MPRIYTWRIEGRSRLLLKAIKICGGQAQLGRMLGIERSAVAQWNTVPKTRIKAVKAIINGK